MSPIYVIADTSSILFAMAQRKNLFALISEEIPGAKILISRGVIAELDKLSKSKRKNSRDARASLLALASASLEIAEDSSYVDEWIASEFEKRKCIVITNDAILRRRLRRYGARTLSVSVGGRLR